MIKTRKRKCTVLFAILLISVSFITVFSKCSPLYGFNNSPDVTVIFEVGRRMFDGQLLYRDVIDQKGPFLFVIYGIASLISDSSYIGLYFTEILFSFISLCFVYKTVSLKYDSKRSLLATFFVACLMYCCPLNTYGGDTAELMMMPFFVYLYYIGFRYVYKNVSIKPYEYLIVGITPADRILIDSIPEALASTDFVCSSVNVGSTKSGINMDAVKLMGETIVKTSEISKTCEVNGCAKLVVFCNAPEDNPFMAGAFHGSGEGDCVINVGVSGPGVILAAAKEYKGRPINELADGIKKMAFKITRMGQLVGSEAAKRLGVDFGILDLSLAPTPEVGDSVARILEEIGLEGAGAPGTTAALAMLTDMVKKGGVMASTNVGG